MVLTQKESTLIKDLLGQEQLCIDKYTRHAECAHDPALKDLFTKIAGVEQEHKNTLSQIQQGNVPSMSGSKQSTPPSFTPYHTSGDTPEKQQDFYLCTDLLTTEKHASGLYDTCVFEFGQPELRQILNHIQTEEQQHGEQIYRYMKANGMCS
jgi:rubrerythrin